MEHGLIFLKSKKNLWSRSAFYLAHTLIYPEKHSLNSKKTNDSQPWFAVSWSQLVPEGIFLNILIQGKQNHKMMRKTTSITEQQIVEELRFPVFLKFYLRMIRWKRMKRKSRLEFIELPTISLFLFSDSWANSL